MSAPATTLRGVQRRPQRSARRPPAARQALAPTLPLVLFAVCALTGCIPPMANMQGPEVVRKGQARFTAHYSVIENADASVDAEPTDAVGFLIGNPIGDGAEFQLRFDYFRSRDASDDDVGIAFIGIGPKFRTFSEHLALVIPAGFYVNSQDVAFGTFQIMPGLIAGVRPHPRIEPVGAVRFVLPVDQDLERWAIANAGLRLSPISPKWAIIPEAALAWDLEGDIDTRLES